MKFVVLKVLVFSLFILLFCKVLIIFLNLLIYCLNSYIIDIVGGSVNKIINKLKNREILSYDELSLFFMGYLNDKVNDEEMTVCLKLICKNGLSDDEIFNLTDIFIRSGEVLPKNSSFIDKHSTGGVGDKTTLIVLPVLASLGVKISKMSGRALGYTGGTIDKLDSIGVKTALTKKEFYDLIGKTNMVVSSQTDNLCPLDKKVYALRDVTGTTKSVALIAVSIMSKKIASGAGKILIDIKVGTGALVEDKKQARELARIMIAIGKRYDRKVICMLTRMDNPLGDNIGNKIEVMEVVDILKNGKRNNLSVLCIEMASLMYFMSKDVSMDIARDRVKYAISSGKAYKTFEEFVSLQGGNIPNGDDDKCYELKAVRSGYIRNINSMIIGRTSMMLGAGRIKKTDNIDFDAGIILKKNVGDYVRKGDVLMNLYGKKLSFDKVYDAYKFSFFKPFRKSIIIDVME